MRRAARVDNNHGDAIKALRQAGMTVKDVSPLKAFGDLVVGFRGLNLIIEMKDGDKPPSARALTADEQEFHDTWAGTIVVCNSPEEAVVAVINYAKGMGRL